ncbi:MAG TPA: hypothetical protein VFL66_03770 [Gaiellaceae bacterium]|nr:hypothetical protein [Gaiellaceae bacterium]
MRPGLLGVILAAALLAAGATAAAPPRPMTLLLARAHGRGAVTVSAPTTHLHGRVWLYRIGGSGLARGTGDVSCTRATGPGAAMGSDEYFRFTLRPNRRLELWRVGGESCTVSATLHAAGMLRVELRGY